MSADRIDDAFAIAERVRNGSNSATGIVEDTLRRIDADNWRYNAFTTITRERALRKARAIDAQHRAGQALPPLAGVPFAVKNLFDVAGLTTLAGAKIFADRAPAQRDATIVARLEQAGAICVGALNMDEHAYGFTTENAHYGTTLNPHDPARVAGGSSGGSAAAVAAGLVPIALGTDTNGSIRVPASLCGIHGLKPTYGRLPRTGTAPFVSSLDHVGPFARSVRDLAAAYDCMQGADDADPVCAVAAVEPVSAHLRAGADGLRIAVADDYFVRFAGPDAQQAVRIAAEALGVKRTVTLPQAERARAAAFVITACEGGRLHLDDLRRRAAGFDPATRDRLIAGALLPAAWYQKAQRFRAWFRAAVARAMLDVDVILAPATPIVAPRIGEDSFTIGDTTFPTRPSLGLLTQPLSFIGLPIVAAPVHRPGALPIGIQVIAAPWREDHALRVAYALEAAGVTCAPVARPRIEVAAA